VVTDEVAFAFEHDEPYEVPKAPDQTEPIIQFTDPHWGPRVALVFPVTDKASAARFLDRLRAALQGKQNAISNVWIWNYKDLGIEFREIKTIDPDYPTFAIGQLELQGRECIVVTTTGQFLNEIVHQKNAVEQGTPSGLQSNVAFRQAGEAATGYGQGFAFLSSPNLRRVLSDFAIVRAEEQTRPDWTKVRREIERQVVAKRPELRNRDLDEVRREIESEVDEEITRQEKTWKDVTVPTKTEELRADLDALEMLRWMTVVLEVQDRDIELRLRLATPANFGD
jgi:hypothetical protein